MLEEAHGRSAGLRLFMLEADTRNACPVLEIVASTKGAKLTRTLRYRDERNWKKLHAPHGPGLEIFAFHKGCKTYPNAAISRRTKPEKATRFNIVLRQLKSLFYGCRSASAGETAMSG